MKNILTFDVEDISDTTLLKDKASPYNYNNLSKWISEILSSLNKTNTKATFFILGHVAKKLKSLVLTIHKEGHEIASHGMNHELVTNLSKERFFNDIVRSKCLLEDIIQSPIYGYRAPSWSVFPDAIWALTILKEVGFKYDASLFPAKTFLFGDKTGKTMIYEFSSGFYEIPSSVFKFLDFRIPFGSGFFFRLYPYFLTKAFLNRNQNADRFSLICLHPYDFECKIKKIRTNLRDKFIHFYNNHKTSYKLDKLLEQFMFSPIKDVIGL